MKRKRNIIISRKGTEKITNSQVLSDEEKKSYLKHINYLSLEEREELYSLI